jgi:GT2 family glycosyltransferase
MIFKENNLTKVLVSILIYNGGEKSIRTISDIICQSLDGIDLDLLIIDNGSTNGFINNLSKLFPNINFIISKDNLGFSGGNNIAIEQALKINADFLFVLNDDIQISSDYIFTMVHNGSKCPDAAAIGSTIILTNGKIQAVSGNLKIWQAGVQWSNKKSSITKSQIRKVDVIQGAAFVLTKKALIKGFKFDNCLFFGGEEYDLACWAKSVFLKIYVIEHVEVIHNTNQMSQIENRWFPSPAVYYYGIRNNIYVKHKYAISTAEYIFAITYTSLRAIIKGLIFICNGRMDMMVIMIRGIVDGITKKMGKLPSRNKL